MGNSTEPKEEHGTLTHDASHEPGEYGRSGEGSVSAMAYMISQGQQHRHQTGEADDAAGSGRP